MVSTTRIDLSSFFYTPTAMGRFDAIATMRKHHSCLIAEKLSVALKRCSYTTFQIIVEIF